MATHHILENLFLVDLDLPIPGFSHFISSWIIKEGDRGIIIDPGPSATINTLHNALREIGIKGIDYILLTHIHLDHAGGCGDLIKSYPDCVIFCHPQAVTHLADPAKLWLGSVNVLGDLARAYGQPSPVNRERICSESDILWKDYLIQSLETPGHASHHLCFFFGNLVFAGEVAGVSVPSGNKSYIRPATPSPFRPDIALKSISLVIERGPQLMCYGHYGLLEDAVSMLQMAKEQIRFWLTIIEERHNKGLKLDEEEICAEILAKDSHLSSFYQLESDIRKREAYFIKNSIKGMLEFINR
ncbi:MAG: MBL fold metallo-hydrolase [Deltaproteobacteria bacterium]|nr:MAG: MBL fold metallo-hydrolase [Deltaproteobacteria bacterium]